MSKPELTLMVYGCFFYAPLCYFHSEFSPGGKQLSSGRLDDSPAGWCGRVMFLVDIRNVNTGLNNRCLWPKCWIFWLNLLSRSELSQTLNNIFTSHRLIRTGNLTIKWICCGKNDFHENVTYFQLPHIFYLAFLKLVILKLIDWLLGKTQSH